ncbi:MULTISPECIES: SUMF1/EgtB/PvdO family nonheme iron enzyme [Cyanophyceae]|uniref:SUMF1/EgtB/PvdO family nonheme iron enzyme n=1 Tax=Cyanophyceae TaxID=3028117 RepID=UPI001682BAFB|nr:SUMF1/EgtB/PvdO family nonheme iron enzyme [Trichocoleus sp. FACHB-40]MBD2005542.1 SUMF1/EgtB/PvdO family nonheme iron enzyme [Trichocoleus sp. FACHB-40]
MANNWAVAIGINHYEHHPERQLKYAANDAQQLSTFLTNHAGFPLDHLLLCLGDEKYKGSQTYPNCSNLLKLLNRDLHPKRLGNVDRFWFFFSGHGISRNGRDYLLTSDSILEDIDLKIALPVDEVIAALRQHQKAEIVLILDSCREQVGSRSLSSTTSQKTLEVAQQRGITTIFSCDYGQLSYEIDALGNGTFTYALVEGLQRYTLPHKLERYLQHRVQELNHQNNKRVNQTPRIRIEPASKIHYPLLSNCATKEDIVVLLDLAKDAELEEDFGQAKNLWWQVIEASTSREQIAEARKAIERIERKSTQNSVSFSNSPYEQVPSPSSSVELSPTVPSESLPSRAYSSRSLERPTQSRFANQQENLPIFSTPSQSTEGLEEQQDTKLIIPSIPGTQAFEFTVVMVDIQGKEISRRRGQAHYLTEDIGNGVTLEMVYIPGGEFSMGSPESEGKRYSNERPQHSVTVKPFLISKYPIIIQAQWREVAALSEVHQKLNLRPSRPGGKSHPVTQVSWHDAVEFCDRLSQTTGHEYRLPTEAEWEYACRAGTTTPFHFGETITSDLANYDGRYLYGSEPKGIYREKTNSIGTFQVANAFGLFDMHGNVWEWCLDHWHESYDNAPITGEAWIDCSNNQTRLMRGGSWRNEPLRCRSASRWHSNINQQSHNIGFRIIRSL